MRLSCLLLLIAAGAAGSEVNVRIDVNAISSRIQLAGGKVMPGSSGSAVQANWLREASLRPCYLISQFSIPAMTWTEVAFSFTPSAAGKATLSLSGPWRQKVILDSFSSDMIPVTYDNVRVEGATLVNGSFETPTYGRGQLAKGWTNVVFSEYPRLVVNPFAAQDGAKAVEVWSNCPMNQVITVQAGVLVTVRAWAWSNVPTAP